MLSKNAVILVQGLQKPNLILCIYSRNNKIKATKKTKINKSPFDLVHTEGIRRVLFIFFIKNYNRYGSCFPIHSIWTVSVYFRHAKKTNNRFKTPPNEWYHWLYLVYYFCLLCGRPTQSVRHGGISTISLLNPLFFVYKDMKLSSRRKYLCRYQKKAKESRINSSTNVSSYCWIIHLILTHLICYCRYCLSHATLSLLFISMRFQFGFFCF